MFFKQKGSILIGLIGLFITLMLVGGVQFTGLAATPDAVEVGPNGLHDDRAGFTIFESDIPAEILADTPCHNVTGYADEIEYDDFCVYYNIADTSTADATDVGDIAEEYWDRYVDDFGFLPPLQNHATNKIELIIVDSSSCNGSAYDNYMKVYNGCFGSEENMRQVIGHEMFHRIQFNYDSDWNPNWPDIAWFYEGTARASEDMVFDMVDNWAGAMGVGFSFNREVNEYLAATNYDLTSYGRRYEAALWWKYFSEQFGSVTTEPERGIDTFLELWENADTSDDIAAVNAAMSGLGAGMTFDTAFRKFTAANYTKDLSGLPDGSYNYIDEEQAGNSATYGPISPTSGGTISGASPSTDWTGATVNRYSARYYQADVGSNCPVVSASFQSASPNVFYHVITQNGTALGTHREGSGADWTQAFLNDGITKITAVIGGQANSATVDIEFSCANPVVDIQLPNDVAVAHVWRHGAPQRFLAQVLVTDGSPTGPVVAGLTNADFAVKVNNKLGTIETGGFIQEQYWLVVQAPTQAADGTYDLKVELQEPGTSTEIASDTNANSIVYDTERFDHVLVVDSSGSMSTDSKLLAAKDAANFYVDMIRTNDGIAAVAYNHDVVAASTEISKAHTVEKDAARALINGLTASGATSIGDGLNEAYDLRENHSNTGWPNCSFVLLSDGMENSSLYWSNVRTDVIDTGCPVTAVAFGSDSDETLMQTIATETGGSYYFNDVFVSEPAIAAATSPQDMALELGGIYEYAQGNSERRQRLLSEKGTLIGQEPFSHTVMIDDSISEALFALDWIPYRLDQLALMLEKPDGTLLNCADQDDYFFNYSSGHLGCRVNIPSADAGEWTVGVHYLEGAAKIMPYQLFVSAPSSLFMQMVLPSQLGRQFYTGDFLPLIAMIAGDGAVRDATVETTVKCGSQETKVKLYDDGNHGDGLAGDGFYGNEFRRVTQASVNNPIYEPGGALVQANDEGSCSVALMAYNGDFQREAIGGFSVLEAEDSDPENGVPDTIDDAYGDLTADPDLDEADTHSEYGYGTDPFNSDTDGGGENDYSEMAIHGSNPFDPSDDMIEAPDFLQTQAQNGSVKLLYDVKDEYVGIKYYHKKVGDSQWTLSASELPLAGTFDFPATNGETYIFAMRAYDGDDHRSAVVFSEVVTPSEDPLPPEAHVLVNNGAPSTVNRDVTLNFVPYEYPQPDFTEAFDDITEMKISNDPLLAGAEWQPFLQGVPWELSSSSNYGDVAKVYVKFKDAHGNQTIGVELGQIIYAPDVILLPLVSRGAQ
jgi:Mg-chelatase subunit ChlD